MDEPRKIVRRLVAGTFGWYCLNCEAIGLHSDGGGADRLARKDAAAHVRETGHRVMVGKATQVMEPKDPE